MTDEPIPSLAEALTEIRRLRARIVELDGQMRRNAEIWLVETDRSLARIAELEASTAITFGTLEQPTPDEPTTIEHNIPPNAPPHNE